MRLLVLGGSGWLSGEVARAALAEGDDVTCVTRSGAVPDGAVSVIADRSVPGALASVVAERWDAVIDVSSQPGQVREAAVALHTGAARYVYVSSASVYASHASPGADETDPVLDAYGGDEWSEMTDYGAAKVACENAVLESFGAERSVIARAGLIGGPGDTTGRTNYWPWRFAHPVDGEAVLAPSAPDLPTAVIDVRDLAAFLLYAARHGSRGTFNLLGESVSFPDHLTVAREVAGSAARIVEVDSEWAAHREISPWAGPRSFPLWLPGEDWLAMGDRDTSRAARAGLVRRPLAETLRDGLRWREAEPGDVFAAGLSDDDERRLLRDALSD